MNLSRIRDLRLRLIHLGELPWSEDLVELFENVEDVLREHDDLDQLYTEYDEAKGAQEELREAEKRVETAEARLEEYLQAEGQDPKTMVARVIRLERELRDLQTENTRLREELTKPKARRARKPKAELCPLCDHEHVPGAEHVLPPKKPDNVIRPTFGAKDPVKAYELYTKAGELDEDPKTFAEAERLYREALRLDPSLAVARTNLANIYHRRGRVETAERMYEESYRADPSEPCAIYNLGYCCMGREEWDRAAQYLREALTRCNASSDATLRGDTLYNLAVCLDSLGKVDEARQVWKDTAKAMSPDSEWTGRVQARLTELGIAKPKFAVIRGEKRS